MVERLQEDEGEEGEFRKKMKEKKGKEREKQTCFK